MVTLPRDKADAFCKEIEVCLMYCNTVIVNAYIQYM